MPRDLYVQYLSIPQSVAVVSMNKQLPVPNNRHHKSEKTTQISEVTPIVISLLEPVSSHPITTTGPHKFIIMQNHNVFPLSTEDVRQIINI